LRVFSTRPQRANDISDTGLQFIHPADGEKEAEFLKREVFQNKHVVAYWFQEGHYYGLYDSEVQNAGQQGYHSVIVEAPIGILPMLKLSVEKDGKGKVRGMFVKADFDTCRAAMTSRGEQEEQIMEHKSWNEEQTKLWEKLASHLDLTINTSTATLQEAGLFMKAFFSLPGVSNV